MAKKDEFSKVLSEMPAPATPDGRSLQSAAAANAEAAKVAAASFAQGVGFLGTLGVEGVKGSLVASQEEEINAVLRRLSSRAEADIDANNQRLADQLLESAESVDYAGQATLAYFTDEARKYAEARRQGVISREEAVAQIGAIVKKYSAMVPGFASDFRKKAAELTGISNIDVYGVHKELTEQSIREKLLQKQAEADLQLRKEAASALGLSSINELTPDALAFYRRVKSSEMRIKAMQIAKNERDITREEVDRVNIALVQEHISHTVAGLVSRFAQLGAAHLAADTPAKQQEAQKLGAQLSAELDVAETQLVAKIKGLASGQNAMDATRNRQLVEEVQSIFKTYKEVVKTQEGYNLWANIVKNAKGNADHVLNQFTIAHPHAAVLLKHGVMSEFVKAMVALGDPQAFQTRFGPELTKAVTAVLQGPGYPDALSAVAAGQAGVQDIQKVNPQMARVAYHDIVRIIENLAKNGGILDDKTKQTFSNYVHQWLHNMNHTDVANLKKFKEIAGNPEGGFWKQMRQLNPDQRKHALLPLFDKIVNTTPNVLQDMKKTVETYNQLEENQKLGHKVEIRFDPLTNSFKVAIEEGKGNAFALTQDKNKARMATPFGLAGFGVSSRGTPAQREALGVLEQRVAWLNSIPDVMSQALPLGSDAFSGIKPSEIGLAMWKAYQDGKGGIGEALIQKMNEQLVPKNPDDAPATDRPMMSADNKDDPAEAAARDKAAAEIRKKEGVSMKDVEEIEAAIKTLKRVDMDKRGASDALRMLERELRITKMALEL